MRSLPVVFVALALGLAAWPARGHTISLGFENAGAPGSVNFWAGNYTHGAPGANTPEGSLSLKGVNGTVFPEVILPFDFFAVVKPAGLVDGVNNFFASGPSGAAGSGFPLTPTNTLAGLPVTTWQGVTVNGLTPGDYMFAFIQRVSPPPTASWTEWNDGLNNTFSLTGEIVQPEKVTITFDDHIPALNAVAPRPWVPPGCMPAVNPTCDPNHAMNTFDPQFDDGYQAEGVFFSTDTPGASLLARGPGISYADDGGVLLSSATGDPRCAPPCSVASIGNIILTFVDPITGLPAVTDMVSVRVADNPADPNPQQQWSVAIYDLDGNLIDIQQGTDSNVDVDFMAQGIHELIFTASGDAESLDTVMFNPPTMVPEAGTLAYLALAAAGLAYRRRNTGRTA